MTSKSITKQLQQLGLTEQESAVYLHCLSTPKQTPTKIAEYTKINRGVVYKIVSALKDKGFLYEKVTKRKRFIFAYSPDVSTQTVQKELQSNTKQLVDLIPKIESQLQELSANQPKSTAKSDISILTGVAGMKQFVQHAMDLREDMYWIGPSEVFSNMMSREDMFQQFSAKRMEQGTLSRAMSDNKLVGDSLFYGGPETFRQMKVLDFPSKTNAIIAVAGNSLAFIKYDGGKPEALVVQDELYANILKFALELVWKSL